MPLLFFNPPNPAGLQANRDYMGNFGMLNSRPGVVLPPLHLIQMAGTLPAAEIVFVDAASENITAEACRARIKSASFDAAIVLTSTPTFDADCEMARWLKSEFCRPVYLYGPHPAHVPDEAFQKSGVDGILVGYTPKTATLLNTRKVPTELEELIHPGSQRLPPPVAPGFNMDDLPFGAWSHAPMERYRFDLVEPRPFATMRSSLGCVYSCAYCPYVLAEGQRFLPMSPERTYAEMEYLAKDFAVRFILFRDLLFTVQRKRIEDLSRLLIDRPLPLTWRCETSTQHLSRDLLELMRKAGCSGINLGVESVDDPSAEEMDLVAKRRNLDHLKSIFQWCNELGIRTNALFVIGFPEDSRSGIEKSIEFAKSLNAHTVQFSFATPFPGTGLAAIAEREGLLESKAWSDFSSIRPIMRTRHLTRTEVQELGKRALRSVYMQPRRIARMACNPWKFVRRAHAFVRFYVEH